MSPQHAALAVLVALVVAPATRPARAVERPVLYVLAVGAAQHRVREHNLMYADRDAVVAAEALAVAAGDGHASVSSAILTGRAARAAKVLEALERIASEAGPDDTVLLFFSGHGGTDPKHGFLFVTYEIDERKYADGCLRWRDVADVLRKMSAKRIVLFVDACEAGSALQSSGIDASRHTLGSPAALAVFASSSPHDSSIELPRRYHGAFTAALLDGLAGAADGLTEPADGAITLEELGAYLTRRVLELTKGEQRPNPVKPGGLPVATVVARTAPAG